jgi:hypothetical protein
MMMRIIIIVVVARAVLTDDTKNRVSIDLDAHKKPLLSLSSSSSFRVHWESAAVFLSLFVHVHDLGQLDIIVRKFDGRVVVVVSSSSSSSLSSKIRRDDRVGSALRYRHPALVPARRGNDFCLVVVVFIVVVVMSRRRKKGRRAALTKTPARVEREVLRVFVSTTRRPPRCGFIAKNNTRACHLLCRDPPFSSTQKVPFLTSI